MIRRSLLVACFLINRDGWIEQMLLVKANTPEF